MSYFFSALDCYCFSPLLRIKRRVKIGGERISSEMRLLLAQLGTAFLAVLGWARDDIQIEMPLLFKQQCLTSDSTA